MNTIPSSFSKRGFEHREIAREGDWRLFERSRHGRIHWEVVRIRIGKAYEIAGKQFPEGEVYPASKKWGIDGFTLPTLESGVAKLAQMARKTSSV